MLSIILWPSVPSSSAVIVAFVACIAAIVYGAYATHLFAFLGEDPDRYWGPAPLEAWLLAGGLYVVGVAICRAVAPTAVGKLLGFDSHSLANAIQPRAVIDIASEAEARVPLPLASPVLRRATSASAQAAPQADRRPS